MLEAFVRSPHCRTKDEKHRRKALERADYLNRTADKAIAGCGRTAAEEDRSAKAHQNTPEKKENTIMNKNVAKGEPSPPTSGRDPTRLPYSSLFGR